MISLLEKLHQVHLAEPQRWCGASLRAGQGHRPLCQPTPEPLCLRAFPCTGAFCFIL